MQVQNLKSKSSKELKMYLERLNLPPKDRERIYTECLPFLKNDLDSLYIFLDLIDMYYQSEDLETIYSLFMVNKYRFKQFSLYWKRLLEHSVLYMKLDFNKTFDKIIHLISKQVFDMKYNLIEYLNENREEYKLKFIENKRITQLKSIDISTPNIDNTTYFNTDINEPPKEDKLMSFTMNKTSATLTRIENNYKEVANILENNSKELVNSTENESNNIFIINNKPVIILGEIAKGGFSTVNKVIYDNEVYAMKRSYRGNFKKELEILQKVSSYPWGIKLIASDINIKLHTSILIMEYGEIDLQRFIDNNVMNICLIKSIWKDLLEIIISLHNIKIIHKDIKPANFVFVKDRLKIIDFNISVEMGPDTTSCLNSKEGTAYYSSPEVFFKKNVSRSADIWSAGCILYYMVYKRVIIDRAYLNDSRRINVYDFFKNKESIIYPSIGADNIKITNNLIETLKSCLKYEPEFRIKVKDLINSDFLNS
ncbi:MPS1 [Hepatospora eriocheir]|uniref:MPS1 n=1 Tax=Hepatospora eriocheir TaxID=1081669 RepID=A0A1X0Q7W8_9MICR|nr:MPS1 [Hepatospora eriocheir]